MIHFNRIGLLGLANNFDFAEIKFHLKRLSLWRVLALFLSKVAAYFHFLISVGEEISQRINNEMCVNNARYAQKYANKIRYKKREKKIMKDKINIFKTNDDTPELGWHATYRIYKNNIFKQIELTTA